MSTAKIQEPVYKVYEPGYHPHRTIILDEQVESPETLTIRLEEEAARNGGDLTRGCPPVSCPCRCYADSTYSQYSSQPFSSQQTENAASQINQMAFAANNAAAGQYLGASQVTPPNSVNVLSCHPSGGPQGTKVSLKATCQYDLVGSSVAASAPFVSLVFGSHRCAAKVARDSRDGSGACTYTITAAAPQFLSTGCPSLSNVPLTLLVESASGDELARVPNVGAFSYHDVQGGAAGGSAGFGVPDESSPPDLGSPKTRSPVHRPSPPSHDGQAQAKTTSQVAHPALTEEASTNTYGFSPSVSAPNTAAQIHAQPQTHPDFATAATGAYSQGSSSMLSSYRAASFTDHYTRAPPMLRSPHGTGWMFGSQLDPFRASTSALSHGTHAAVSRPSLTPLQHAGSPTPQLVRTSTLAQPAGGFPYGVYQEKATLKIIGDLSSMAEGWTQEEWENKRRLVLFRKQQTGSVLTVSFKPVSVAERPPHSICISCIWWEEKQACYVTSVDTIHLLEQLLAAPNRFGVDEKNRIRRNLEGFRPATVSKARAESEEFFKVIMGFGNPKPRNIEKDVKVFHWKDLSGALYKIISKYSASTTTVMTPNSSPHVATTVGLTGSYPALPPTPVSSTSSIAADTAASAGYAGAAGHHHADSLASPRTLSGGPSSWSTYDAAAAKTLSPGLKTNSPVGTSGLRLSAMPVVYDHRGSTHSLASPYGLSTPAHHNAHHTHAGYGHSGVPASQAQSRSWEGYSVAAADGYTSQAGSGHGQVYGGAAYEDGGPRA
ncbi:8be7161d-6d04-4df6-9f61-1f200cd1e119 [Thermothielavioides terrestris]|uniref:8be7161d-6d04-4df6-9f61-1f200cd1e119 n=1 Tax=Thermothielavioides terrestris TaxID=2587410 RepID=A0A3S4BMF8_9PEZI|nr:8be7161d-6d04-4df6-9f61-1f200cd1e119 [Thermothielavioides terrestris]